MKKLRLAPDAWNAWIYDTKHRDYNSEYAKNLRNRRSYAIRHAPDIIKFDAYVTELAIRDMEKKS